VGQTGTVVIPFVVQENLGLVFQPPKGGTVDDPVTVALKHGTGIRGLFRVFAPFGGAASAGKRG
jgi:hypothetical protein